jgi:signal transduction histidine kinase/PAS domain-containing protein
MGGRNGQMFGGKRFSMRLLMGGVAIYLALWWVLDHLHTRELSQVVDQQLSERVEQKAARDSLRVDNLLHAQQTYSLLLAQIEGAVKEVAAFGAEPPASPPRIINGEPGWLPRVGERNLFPPVDLIALADAQGRLRRIWRVESATVPAGLEADLARVRSGDRAALILINGSPALVSAAQVAGGGGRLLLVSNLNLSFVRSTLSNYLDRGFVLVLYDYGSGNVLVSSNPDQVPPGVLVEQLKQNYIISSPYLIGKQPADGGIAVASMLTRDRLTSVTEPLIVMERGHRTIFSAVTGALFLGVLLYVALRVRATRARMAILADRVFGTAARNRPGGVDDLADLEAEAEAMVTEVERSRSALSAEEAQRVRLLTERMALETENERLAILQAVTDEMGVGIIRIGPAGPRAENAVMRRFSEVAGGLGVFIRARTRGEDQIRIGEGETERIFEVLVARQVDAGLLLVRDVTERARAEDAMQTYAQFPTQNPHPVIRVDAQGVVSHANPASASLLEEWGTAVGGQLGEEWRTIFDEVQSSGRQREIEVTVGERILSLWLVPLPSARVVNLYGADVTARVAAERLLHMVNESLERRVHQRTEALKAEIAQHVEAKKALIEAKDQADLANRSKTEFLANVSHELRTPLNAIIGFSEVMAAEMFGPLGSERYKGYVNDVLSSGRHLLEVISDILDIAKIEAGKMDFNYSDIDPAEVVAAAVHLVESRAEAGGLRLSWQVPDDAGSFWADRRRVLQILVNLLSNAIKFTPAGGSIDLTVTADTEQVILVVSDTGIGMSEDEVVVALEPFRQVDGSLTRRYEGTGLGLPLVRAFVELHGGRLDIASHKGRGTSVSVVLPRRAVTHAGEALQQAAGE